MKKILEPSRTIIVYMELLKLGDIDFDSLKMYFYESPFFIKAQPLKASLKWLSEHGYIEFDGRKVKVVDGRTLEDRWRIAGGSHKGKSEELKIFYQAFKQRKTRYKTA